MGHAAAGTAVITKQERTCVMPSVAERNRKPVPHELITSESVRGTKRRCLTAISRSPRVQSIVPNSLTSHDASFAWKRQAASHGRRISPDSAVANLDSACQKTYLPHLLVQAWRAAAGLGRRDCVITTVATDVRK
jgi:hypothetical protein